MRPLGTSDPLQIGHYRMLAELGRGGMGRVLLGSGPDGRLVAVKLVGEQFVDDDGFRARFRREVRASRQVAGAYTAAVIDADPEAPQPWLASVYVPGPSLHEVVETTGALAAEPALRLAAGLAAALIEVHRAELVHRDLKPSNVLLTDDGLRVIDFGVARAAEAEDGTQLTRTGGLVGTPGFMSPEQALGKDLTPASDIFSLGSVLVYACTGRGPFQGPNTPRTLHNVIHGEPVLGTLPERLHDIVPACLAKDPAARPTPERLLAAIGEVAPSARPWPAAVHDLIARQDAKVSRLLPAPRQPFETTAVDAPPTGVPAPTVFDPPRASGSGGPNRTGPDRRRVLMVGGALLGLGVLGGGAAWLLSGDDEPGASEPGGEAEAAVKGPIARLTGHTGSIRSLEFDLQGGLLASSGEDGTVRLWDVAARRQSGEPLKVADEEVSKATFDNVGKVLAVVSGKEGVKLYDVRTRRQIGKTLTIRFFDWSPDPAPVTDARFSPDGDMLAVAGTGRVKIWDPDTRKPVGELKLDGLNMLAKVEFSGDGRLLAIPDDQHIGIWDVASGKPVGQSLLGHTAAISHVTMSADGRTLASGGWDKTVRLWDVTTQKPVGEPLRGHEHVIQGLAFTQDGQTLASVSHDNTLRLWDVATQKPIGKPIKGEAGTISAVAFSFDGSLLTTGGDGTVWLWDVSGIRG